LKIKTTSKELKVPSNSQEILEEGIEAYVVNRKAWVRIYLQSTETKLTTSPLPEPTGGRAQTQKHPVQLEEVEVAISEITANLRMPEEEDSGVLITVMESKSPRLLAELK